MVDRDTIQEEVSQKENMCEHCGNKSRIKELEEVIERMIALEAARLRVKGKNVYVSEWPIGESPKQV